MTRRAAALARLDQSRQRLQRVLVGDAAMGTSGALLQHIVRRHPWASALAAASFGALLAQLRPWRWALKPELWSALLPGLLARLAGAAPGTWSEVLAAFLQEVAASAGPDEASAPAEPAA
jgi:hypothetical protein